MREQEAQIEQKTSELEICHEDISNKQVKIESMLAEIADLKEKLKSEFERAYGAGFAAGSRGGK